MPSWLSFSPVRSWCLRLVAVPVVLLGGCIEDFTDPDPEGPVVDVRINTIPLNETMEELFIGTTRQLLAGPVNEEGRYVGGHSVSWSSSNPEVVEISAAGVATAKTSGNVTISATAGGVTGETEMKVRFPVGTVNVGPSGETIRREGAVQLSATVIDQSGITRTNRTVSWSSSNTALATVSSSGLVSGVADGTVTITATSEGVSGIATVIVFGSPVVETVTVTPFNPLVGVGQTTQLTATARAGSGTVISDANVTWSSSNDQVATVSQAGVVTMVAVGEVSITATVVEGDDEISGSVTVFGALVPTILVSGVQVGAPDIAAAEWAEFFVWVPTGATVLNVGTAGGSGDADLYIFAPGVTPSAANLNPNFLAFNNATCFGASAGNTEQCNVANPPAGVWRVRVFAWGPDGTVAGLSLTATVTAP